MVFSNKGILGKSGHAPGFHGAQKMLGWYGGNGFSGTMAFLLNKWVCQPWLPFW